MPPELYGPAGALVVLSFVVLALIHGDLVPGFVYKQEREQRQASEARELKTALALEKLANVATAREARNHRARQAK